MRKIPLDAARPGMILAKDIFGSMGQTLLKTDSELKPRYLSYLEQAGVEYIYIKDVRIGDIVVDDPITDRTRQEARTMVKEITSGLKTSGKQGKVAKSINVGNWDILNTVNKIVDELLENKDVMVQLIDVRSKDNYLFAHSVNCSVLAALVARKMRLNFKELRWIAMGALFHDLGMIAVPDNITGKPGELIDAEYEEVKKHPLLGYEIFKLTDVFDARAGAIVLQHHERYQGQGYPRGLKGTEINTLAQITGIVDVYDALTSDRPYRKAYMPHEAIDMLISWGEEYFDINILHHFLSIVAAYPIGFHVLLSNGESGLIIKNNPGFTLRPVVRVLYKDGETLTPLSQPYDLDLSKVLDLTIEKVLEEG